MIQRNSKTNNNKNSSWWTCHEHSQSVLVDSVCSEGPCVQDLFFLWICNGWLVAEFINVSESISSLFFGASLPSPSPPSLNVFQLSFNTSSGLLSSALYSHWWLLPLFKICRGKYFCLCKMYCSCCKCVCKCKYVICTDNFTFAVAEVGGS